MTWTVANLVIQVLAGILGGYGAAAMMHEYRFGTLGHGLAGAIGGAISGSFFQTLALTMVTATGSLNEVTGGESTVIQIFAGTAAGGVAMLAVALVKRLIDDERSRNP